MYDREQQIDVTNRPGPGESVPLSFILSTKSTGCVYCVSMKTFSYPTQTHIFTLTLNHLSIYFVMTSNH